MTKKQIKRRNRKLNKKSRVKPITPLNFDEIDGITHNVGNNNKMINIPYDTYSKDIININDKNIDKTENNKNQSEGKGKNKNQSENQNEGKNQNKNKNQNENQTNKKTSQKTTSEGKNQGKSENQTKSKNQTRKPPKRRPHDLLKLYERGDISLSQYKAGERLILDYENSFRNRCPLAFAGEVRVQNLKNDLYLIQNIYAWERYNKAIASIDDLRTREIIRMFCIEGKGLTEIDKTIKKVGVAEILLYYGLKDLAKHYREEREEREER
ncbi:MAG: hypothetical protein LBG48_03100 [Rickettsiales bacterium]|jgi:hypothetical protein|nr:hypothetical protein [Rickettsiales bacterium]